jgi:hypothetical protein
MMDTVFLLVLTFLSFHLGKLSGKLSIHPRWGRFWEPSATEVPEQTEDTEVIEWYHEECGSNLEHDATVCPGCGSEIDAYSDANDLEHDGLPMWKLGEN